MPFALGGDQLVELFDLVAELDRQRIRLQLAGIFDCLHRIKLHQGAINFSIISSHEGIDLSLVEKLGDVKWYCLNQKFRLGIILWNNIGGLGGLIIDNENIPSFQLPNDHFDVFSLKLPSV